MAKVLILLQESLFCFALSVTSGPVPLSLSGTSDPVPCQETIRRAKCSEETNSQEEKNELSSGFEPHYVALYEYDLTTDIPIRVWNEEIMFFIIIPTQEDNQEI